MKQRTTPSLVDVLEELKKDIFFDLNCHRLGIINSFNSDEQTVEVSLVDKRVIQTTEGERLFDFPVITDCPIVINKPSRGGFTSPITAGDTCLVLFNDRNMDSWLEDGLIQKPETNRSHAITDAIALIGIRNKVNKIVGYNNNATEMNFGTSLISLSEGKSEIKSGVGGEIILDADVKIKSVSGGEVNIDDKIEIKNAALDLKLVIDELIEVIKALKVLLPPGTLLSLDSSTIAALDLVKIKIGLLLK